MADFVAVLKKTIDGLDEANPEVRRKVYDKARATIAAKLGQINPPPPPAVAERQKKALEDAIEKVEAEYNMAATGGEEPVDELEAIFASLSAPEPKASSKPAEPAAFANRAAEKPATPLPSALSGAQKPAPDGPQKSTPAQPEAPAKASPAPSDQDFFFEAQDDSLAGEVPLPPRRHGRGGLIVALLALIVIAGAAYGGWIKREDLASTLGVQLPEFARTQPTSTKPAPKKTAAAKPTRTANNAVAGKTANAKSSAENKPGEETPQPAAPTPAAATKFTQRLGADGAESNPGPASGEAKVGEGTSVASATPSSAEANAPAAQGAPAANAGKSEIPVGQRAIFYEERTNTEPGSANTGTVVWSMVKESPGGDLPAEPAIRGEMTIPAKNLQLRITIRRNGDKTLPASHIVELIFLTPDNFDGGGIDSVLRMALKDSEQAPGSPMIGIPAKIADGYFLLALNDGKAEVETNTTLLRRESWIDIPVVYKSGRRALVTLEKGIPGDKVFEGVLNAWDQTPIGQEPAPASDDSDGNSNKSDDAAKSSTNG